MNSDVEKEVGRGSSAWKADMIGVTIFGAFCIGGIVFLIRFFVALCGKHEPERCGMWFTHRGNLPSLSASRGQRECPGRTKTGHGRCCPRAPSRACSPVRSELSVAQEDEQIYMSVVQDCSAEELAKLFLHYRNALAGDFDRAASANPPAWERTPENERKLMVAAARLALLDLSTKKREVSRQDNDHTEFDPRYFSRPGEAEWGGLIGRHGQGGH
jgi:hypothetical protein